MNNIIAAESLTKTFGRTRAVRGISFCVPSNSIYAFIGPNGAGKTTTIHVLMNILRPTWGRALVLGTDSTRLKPAHFRRIGYVSENQRLPGWMTVARLVDYCVPMYPTWDRHFCDRLLDRLALPPGQRIRNLSRGMRVKAALLTALAFRPSLLVLDEPFSGLDPLVRDELIQAILELSAQEEWTVFVSSHDIEEVERLADWVGFLDHGKLLFNEAVSSLQQRFRRVEAVLTEAVAEVAEPPSNWLDLGIAGHTAGFVDCDYEPQRSNSQIESVFQGVEHVNVFPLSLKEVFLIVARTGRPTLDPGGDP